MISPPLLFDFSWSLFPNSIERNAAAFFAFLWTLYLFSVLFSSRFFCFPINCILVEFSLLFHFCSLNLFFRFFQTLIVFFVHLFFSLDSRKLDARKAVIGKIKSFPFLFFLFGKTPTLLLNYDHLLHKVKNIPIEFSNFF